MNTSQRWLAHIAFGLVLAVMASTANGLFNSGFDGGWFNYAPNNGIVEDTTQANLVVRRAFVWLVVIGVWFVVGRSWLGDE
ncbi:MAG: hypothetical protein AAF962_06215 [Actinomycetota bacterium]